MGKAQLIQTTSQLCVDCKYRPICPLLAGQRPFRADPYRLSLALVAFATKADIKHLQDPLPHRDMEADYLLQVENFCNS